jgi:rhamnulokinase
MPHYLACDLGAESGRVMLGSFAGGRLTLKEIHRFPNTPIRGGASMYWDVPALLAGIKEGLRQSVDHVPAADLRSISCDTWGLDCVLLDREGELIEPVFHYRDPRTAEGVRRVFEKLPWPDVFAETGIQFMPINALYHLAMETPERLERAHRIVPIGDAFNYFLCGVMRAEVSMASTTQLYNPIAHDWAPKVLEAVGLGPERFPEIVNSGSALGPLRPELSVELGLPAIEVVASCTHDTGAAVAAVPAAGELSDQPNWAYLSSGTWSLMGIERRSPLINDECRELNLTNEIGYGGSIRLLKNIIGLWLVQECRRTWAEAGNEFDYTTLTQLAAAATPFKSLIDPDDERFLPAGDMPERIAAYCRETSQSVPETPGEFVRTCLESLALLYQRTLQNLAKLGSTRIERLHVLGGGSQNDLLNQFTADACGVRVLAGPVEATALGNVLVQAITAGDIPSLAEGRAVLGRSVELREFHPGEASGWIQAHERFDKLKAD